ncbi:MAG TPA: tetratricopeptide repeat protein [Chitinophagaceae bacterium]|nr:tetratricopeptide repeat protein [Chitinophagaceae bacterium]
MSNDHKLAAILFADIAGYTAIMQKDEQSAMVQLNRFKEVLVRIAPDHEGRIVQFFGDGCLLAFESSMSGVDCAIALQKAFSETPVVPVRIGLHMGDVVFKNENVFGDGVNIASRIESLGIPGAILMSKTIRDQIKNNSDFLLVSLGSFDFKNVSERMEVFALANPGFVVPKRGEMQGKLKSISKKTVFVKWITAIALIGVLAIVFWFITGQKKSTETISEKSIAVLPFIDMSEGKDQEYFSDGLSEELLNLLSKIPELKVIGRTSSFSFKGKSEDLKSIAQKLGVAHILEGSVRKDGKKIRVTAQLVRATDGSQLWSQTYDRDLEGIFKLQDDIAGAVVKQLKLRLLPTSDGEGSSAINNTDVYNLILQGDYFSDKRDSLSMQKAMALYRDALAIDSLNARSWAGVAKCFTLQATWSWIDRKQGYENARKAATKSIELDNTLAEGHRTLGMVKMNDYDFDGAEREFKNALNLEPGNAEVLRISGYLYRSMGRFDEGIRFIRQSINLDPLRPITYINLGLLQYAANYTDEAIISFKKALELNPQWPRAHTFIGEVYLLQGKPEKTLIEVEQETDKSFKDFGLARAYYALGNTKKADEKVKEITTQTHGNISYRMAIIRAQRGEKDKALELLDQAYKEKDVWLLFLKGDPRLRSLENDPRHTALLKKMNLPAD